MAADLNTLTSEFRKQVRQLFVLCEQHGVLMRPYFSVRSPFEQAQLWRQSRSREEIVAKVAELKRAGAPFLAHCIESVGPQHGNPVTNAIPGLSWHQWGEAVDCFWLLDGQAEWSNSKLANDGNGYRVYSEQAQALGLDAGGLWRKLKDWPHVQLRTASSPLKIYSLAEIDQAMQARFDSTAATPRPTGKKPTAIRATATRHTAAKRRKKKPV